jgi:hypothetical protein
LAQDWCGWEILLVFSGFRPDRDNSLLGLGKMCFTYGLVSSGYCPLPDAIKGTMV